LESGKGIASAADGRLDHGFVEAIAMVKPASRAKRSSARTTAGLECSSAPSPGSHC
jgi:hypothetical protein